MKIPRFIKRVGAVAALLLAGAAMAQDYPAKPVRVVAPFAPGGGSDVVARIVAQKLSVLLNRPFVVDNKPGASGIIGADIVAKAPADGYTILMTNSALTSNPWLYKKLPFNTEKDLIPVIELASSPLVLAAHPTAPFNTLPEMMAYARKNPETVTVGTAGAGQMGHLAGELLSQIGDVKLTMVHYKGGGLAMQDLLAGTVMTSLVTAPSTINQVASGRLKPIAVTGSKRLPSMPKVPTVAESYPGVEAVTWFGTFVPAGTPKPVVDRLTKATAQALADPAVKSRLADEGMEVSTLAGPEFDKRFRSDLARWKKFIQERGIQLDN